MKIAFEINGAYLAFGISIPLVIGFLVTHRRELKGSSDRLFSKKYSHAEAA